jgi:ribosomal protein L40E
MALMLHPHIVELINLGDSLLDGAALWDEFEEALARAQESDQWQQQRFLYFRQGQARSERLEDLAEVAWQALNERSEALRDLKSLLEGSACHEALADSLLTVQKASQRVSKASADLEAALEEVPSLASFPLLQDVLQAGRNVLDGLEPPDILASRVPTLVAWVKDLEVDWAQECELFEALRSGQDEFMQVGEGLKQGVGAIYLFLEQGLPEDLVAGLGGLQDSARQLEAFIAWSQRETVGKHRYSPFRDIERWAIRQGTCAPDDPALEEARQAVMRLLESKQQQLSALGEIPFDSDDFLAAFERLEAILTDEWEAYESGDLESSCQISLSYEAALSDLAESLAGASVDLEGAPALQELRRVLLGVYYGQTPRRFLLSLVQALEPGFLQALANEPEPAAREALQLCCQAFEHIRIGMAEGSVNDLVDAWRLLNSGGAALLAVEAERRALELREQERQQPVCLRCGARNTATSTVCACGARLLAAPSTAAASVFSLSEGESDHGQPAHLRQLLGLAARIQEGSAEGEEIRSELEPHLLRARSLLAQATQARAPGAFQLGVSKFLLGLEKFSSQANQRDLGELSRGVELLLEGSEQLQMPGEPG